MRKTITLLFIGLLFNYSLQAQSLHTSNAATYVWGDTTLQHSAVDITNTGPDTLLVKVYMDNSLATNGHSTYFCWGPTCYTPATTTSPNAVVIPPGATNSTFVGYLNPYGITGLSEISYSFFDKDNVSDSVGITYTYDISIGIEELSNSVSLSNPSPNPSNNLTSFSYDLKSVKNAKLVLSNILGKKVNEIILNEKQQTLIIPTSHLNSGIYFCSIIAEGKILTTKKLVVAHR